MLDAGVTEGAVIDELLAVAQREVGERWHRNELTVADEHRVSGVSTAALGALVNEMGEIDGRGHTVVVCAEGDWHALAAQMFGEALRGRGIGVTVLGGSTPSAVVGDYLVRHEADSLAVSCSLPNSFRGVVSLTDVAHAAGLPVMVGGRAMGADQSRALALGADAWAPDAETAARILARWRDDPPAVDSTSHPSEPQAVALFDRVRELVDEISGEDRISSIVVPSSPHGVRADQVLTHLLECLAAGLLVDDSTVFVDLIDWMFDLFAARRLDPNGIAVALEAIAPHVEIVSPLALPVIAEGVERLRTRVGGA